MDTETWVIVAAAGVLTVVGTLAWWRFADQWADEDKKRFRKRGEGGGGEVRVVKKDGE
ncbi:MAG: hypothetical protein HRU70_08950 [Phycisphaeraceae bacterium]|nr:MAG: hypothetical protein HRU70_08950 [Phycisphaeraceae bacterium]